MIYAFLAYVVVSGIVMGYMVFTIQKVSEGAANERESLENRLMAVLQPVALTQVDAVSAQRPGSVTYEGEEKTLRQHLRESSDAA